jgi:hypothetical protein
MKFKAFNEELKKQFNLMQEHKLFRVQMSGQEVWDSYLNGFTKEENPIFRDPQSSENNCNHDKNFIRRYGNVVAITDNLDVLTLFDNVTASKYANTSNKLAKLVKESEITEVFLETFLDLKTLPYEKVSENATSFQLGHTKTLKLYTQKEVDKFGVVNVNDIYTFHHFHVDLKRQFVDFSGKSVESLMGEFRDSRNVFLRGLSEISLETLKLVKDLINQGSLLDGETHLFKVEQFIKFSEEFAGLSSKEKSLYSWIKSYKLATAKFRNELIGTLSVEISEDLEKACLNWNKRVDPANYMKAIAPITKRQKEEAEKFVYENGYVESFNRRFATLNDVKASEILHVNNEQKRFSIFDKCSVVGGKYVLDSIPEVGVDDFMENILPTCTSLEAYLQSTQKGNMVTLTTAGSESSKPIFKWTNNYSWTFNGNLAGKSQIKAEVSSKGGKVDGVLRFSMLWADGNGDNSDLDLHCIEPNGFRIYFSDKISSGTGGNLDIDITQPSGRLAVENITYPNIERMQDGVYQLKVHQFAERGSKGFKAEVEFAGEVFTYNYDKRVCDKEYVSVANVTLRNGKFTIEHLLPHTSESGDIYGLKVNDFHRVKLACLSPNHWGDSAVGNKHYLFMLENCKTGESLRSFHNENLIPELVAHRKVLEVLAGTTMLPPTEGEELSGLGFNATVKDSLIVRINNNKIIKINYGKL